MDELDREIKAVQLRREQLALARELARERLEKRLLAGPTSVLRTLAALVRGVGRLIVAWWKPALFAGLMVGSGLVYVEWKAHIEHQREMAEDQRRQKALHDFVTKECGQPCREDYTSQDWAACTNQKLDRYYPCVDAATKRFKED